MSGLNEVRRRLVDDPTFYRGVVLDPAAALEPYPLTGEEVLELARELDMARKSADGDGVLRPFERESRMDRRSTDFGSRPKGPGRGGT